MAQIRRCKATADCHSTPVHNIDFITLYIDTYIREISPFMMTTSNCSQCQSIRSMSGCLFYRTITVSNIFFKFHLIII